MLTFTVKKAKNIFEKMRGVIGKNNIQPFLLKTRFGIHTFGVRQTIDVVILDNQNRVVKHATVKPNKFFFWNPRFNTVLELPEGTIKQNAIRLGNVINVIIHY